MNLGTTIIPVPVLKFAVSFMKDRSVPMREQGLGKKKGVAKRKARKRHEEAQASKPEAEKAGPQALSYLAEWTRRDEGGWKFNKTRQTYLLKFWPDRVKIPNDDFKQLLPYLLSLQGPGRQRTLEQARGVAEDAEREDREEGEAQAALVVNVGIEAGARRGMGSAGRGFRLLAKGRQAPRPLGGEFRRMAGAPCPLGGAEGRAPREHTKCNARTQSGGGSSLLLLLPTFCSVRGWMR